MPTILPELKAAVMSILNAAAVKGGALEGVFVTDDKEPERDKEYIWLYRAKAIRDWGSLGARKRDEEPSVLLRVVAIRGGKGPAESEARAFELAAIVEELLDKDVTLDGAVKWCLIENIEEEPQLFDQIWGAHVLLTLKAKAVT